jgi:hypothetical protein
MSDNEIQRNDCDVLIAGAGPVGQVLALQVAQIVEASVALGRLFCETDPDRTALRHVALRDIGAQGIQEGGKDWPLRGGTLLDDGIGGTLGLQVKVGNGTGTALLDDVVAPPRFVLLGRDRDPVDLLSPIPRAAWQHLGGRSAHFGPGGLEDAEGKYEPWFEKLNASVVLIRPDFQLFGGVLDPNATDGLVQDLAERLLA